MSTGAALAQPSATPPSAPAPEPPHVELALRLGVARTTWDQDDPGIDATAPYGDVELAWRLASWVSVGGFLARTRVHDDVANPFGTHAPIPITARYFDAGVRMTLHWHGVFAGVGAGLEYGSENAATSYRGSISEIHVGYTSPPIAAHVSVEIFAMMGSSTTFYDGFTVNTRRLGLGVRF